MHFQKDFLKIVPSKNTFSKLLPLKNRFSEIPFQKCSLKQHQQQQQKKKIKAAPSKYTFTKTFFFKFLPQKILFENLFFKIDLSKSTLKK